MEIQISDGGFGYTEPPFVLVAGQDGSGAEVLAIVENGVVAEVIITNAGSGYLSPPSIFIASPPEAPSLEIRVSRVIVTMNVILGRTYQLESTMDLAEWVEEGEPFMAESEELFQEFEVILGRRYFRITEVTP